ncbi:hypothetical protein D3C76_913950 [compost metagenome]
MELIDTLRPLLTEHAQAFLFLNVLLEQAGLPIPAYPALVVAGTVSQTAPTNTIASTFALAVLACMIADTAWFLVGRRRGAWLMRTVCRISLSPDNCIRKSTDLYRHLGPRLLLIAKFLPGAGALTTVMAGTGGTSLGTFLLYDLAGSAIWVASALMMGIVFEGAVNLMLEALSLYVMPGILALLCSFIAFLAWKWLHRRSLIRRSQKVPRLQVAELKSMQAQGMPLVLVDVRPEAEQATLIPGSVKLSLDAKPRELAKLPADASVIVYCDCPSEISAAYLAERLRTLGHPSVYALQGGYQAWSEQDERQRDSLHV